jgi:conjugal transfer mating pair stabilization protein TraN
MNAKDHRRKGIVSLPVAIFFIALVAAAGVATGLIASGQSSLANTQLKAENVLATRQAELSGLSATSSGSGLLQLGQSSGVTTTIAYALIQTSSGQTTAKPVDYVISPGKTISLNITSMVQSAFGQSPPDIASLTLVTTQGIFITSQVQTVTLTKQVTKDTTQTVQMYYVTQTSSPYYSCNGVVSSSSLCSSSYSATATTHYQCPSWETLVFVNGNYVCQGTSIQATDPIVTTTPGYYSCPSGWTLSGSTCSQLQTYYTWVSGYYTYQQVPYYVPGYWSQYYVPGYWATYQYWVPGYWTSYTYSYTTTQTVWWGYYCAVFGMGCWSAPYCQLGALWCWPVTQTVVHYVTVEVWHPGYWATGQYWVSAYWASYYVPGYWTTQTVQVWHPGYYQANTRTVYNSATWNPPVYTYSCPSGWTLTTTILGPNTCERMGTYTATPLVYFTYSCSSGGTLSGTTCETSYPATYFGPETTNLGSMSYCPSGSQYSCTPYTVTKTVPVTSTVAYETISTQGSSWLVGG